MGNSLITNLEHDLTASDLERVTNYKEHGLPGISDVTSKQLHQMLNLYLEGSTYSQISNTLGVKKIIILYLSHSNGWYATRKDYLNEIHENLKNRVIDTKLRSKEFMLLFVQAMQKRITGKMVKYLATDDEEHMNQIDLKEVAQLMKAIEMINELDSDGKDKKGKTPAIGLHMGEAGVTIEKTGENTLSITPKDNSIGEMLKHYADGRRADEKAKLIEIPKEKKEE